MVYECIESFCVDIVDDDGFTEKQDGMRVKKGSMWKVDDKAVNVMGTDMHMEELTGMNWLELSNRRLSTHFREVH